jgi:ketosteroid isomerase-like protein
MTTQSNAVTQSNAELLRKGYEDFAAGDVPAVLAIFSEDVTFRIPARSPISGEYTGHDEVTGFFQSLAERSNGTFRIDVHDILDNGDDTVVALATHNAQRDDRELALPAVHVWRFKDGKATSHQSFVADDYEQDAFWS